ncbi:hypothetical protein Poli38472_000709 [Pythium oligandrum]|uniref:Uncharacterized protein n=1 Tax=Pythium oligandrum TaxID=41045 RepID=A0A8K1CCF1_PYTOL|nr:hypothetical protein Poli38472_000709 [Pythium oligandrum]|eukprot:TMW60667.1 hypothetical protein Poli38472_000709 [Pythium oligandrum]
MSMLGKRTHAESTMDAEMKHVDDVQEASTTDCFLTTMEERMVDCDVTAFLAKKTLPHPADMPLQYSYSGDTFYVRACYPVDYDKIMDCFQEEDVSGLTLTGSTGVGTSVFMAYFFLRYTLEHPKATIVMTAFAANSNIAEAAVWKDGSGVSAQLLEMRVKKLKEFEQWRMNAALHGVFDVTPRRTNGTLALEQDE